jgi:hypothetical protein
MDKTLIKRSRQPRLRLESIQGELWKNELLDVLNAGLEMTPEDRERILSSNERWKVAVSTRLREHVDAWLETGRSPSGIERAVDRSLEKALDVKNATLAYISRTPPTFTAKRDGLEMAMVGSAYRGLGSIISPPDYESLEGAYEHADSFLPALFLTPWRQRLAKCRRPTCGRYFFLSQPERLFKNGTFCKVCTRQRSIESGAIITGARRLEAEQTLYNLAGARFSAEILSNPLWTKSSAIKNRIAQYLTKQIEKDSTLGSVYLKGKREGVTAKWVAHSKNWNAIDAAAKKLHARGRETPKGRTTEALDAKS